MKFHIIGSNLTYPQARGLEQTLMLYYHTIRTDDKKNNQINGIRLNNPEIDTYILASENVLGYLWNQVSNEVLMWSGK